MCKFTNCERDILTTQTPTLMPRYLHIPHTPDTARTLTLIGRNCLVVSGIVTPPLKIGYRRGKGRRGEICPQGTQKSHSGAAACLVAYLCVPTDDVDVEKEYQLIPIDSI